MFPPQLLQSDAEHVLSAFLQSQDELRAVKSEVAALRLEMQAATQARLESEARRLEADKELATLHRELHKVCVCVWWGGRGGCRGLLLSVVAVVTLQRVQWWMILVPGGCIARWSCLVLLAAAQTTRRGTGSIADASHC
jgi:hypothetical protein